MVSFPSGLSTKTLYATLVSSIRATCPSRLIFLDSIIRVILAEEYRPYSCLLCYVEKTKLEYGNRVSVYPLFLEPEFSY